MTSVSPPLPTSFRYRYILHPAPLHAHLPIPFSECRFSGASASDPMYSTRSTRSTQRQSQRTRQQVARHTEKDYYDCPRCRKLFPRYHGSHRRHIRSCIAKHKIRAWEAARSQAGWIETPTPDPYTPILSDAEMDTGDVGTSV